jgi:hypothetical protein
VSTLRILLALLLLLVTSTRVLAQVDEVDVENETVIEEVIEEIVEPETPAAPPSTVPTVAQRPRILEPQPLGRVEVRQWPYIHIIHEGQHVYYSVDIRQEYVDRALRAISLAHATVPAMMGQPPTQVDYLIFPGQVELRVGAGWIGQIPSRYVMDAVGGLAIQDVGNHVTFMHGDLFREEEANGAWLVAHELTHHLAHQLHGETEVPAWFEEGNAELIAAQFVRQHYPDAYAMETFYRAAFIANGARQGVLPALGPLVEDIAWVAANNADKDDFLYDTAWQMTEWLAGLRDPAAPARVMGMVGQGRSFDQAFAEVFGMPLADIDRGFLAHATGPMASRFPTGMSAIQTTVPANGRVYLVFTGLKPNEIARLEYRSRECRGETTVNMNHLGYATYWIGEVPDRCVGSFTVQMTGSQGTNSTIELNFTPPTGPVASPAR